MQQKENKVQNAVDIIRLCAFSTLSVNAVL